MLVENYDRTVNKEKYGKKDDMVSNDRAQKRIGHDQFDTSIGHIVSTTTQENFHLLLQMMMMIS